MLSFTQKITNDLRHGALSNFAREVLGVTFLYISIVYDSQPFVHFLSTAVQT